MDLNGRYQRSEGEEERGWDHGVEEGVGGWVGEGRGWSDGWEETSSKGKSDDCVSDEYH